MHTCVSCSSKDIRSQGMARDVVKLGVLLVCADRKRAFEVDRHVRQLAFVCEGVDHWDIGGDNNVARGAVICKSNGSNTRCCHFQFRFVQQFGLQIAMPQFLSGSPLAGLQHTPVNDIPKLNKIFIGCFDTRNICI